MNRLQKFVEHGADGDNPGRTAYAFGPTNLPEPGKDMEWRPVVPFSAAEELLRDAGLKDVFKAAIANGCAVVSKTFREASGNRQRKSAAELEEILTQRIGAGDFKVTVHSDPELGWRAKVYGGEAAEVHRCQVMADTIAAELCQHYKLDE